MNQFNLKNFLISILKDKRYWLVLVIFVFVFVFGKKVTGEHGFPGSYSENPFYGWDYQISKDGKTVEVNNLINAKNGDYYRLIFEARKNKLTSSTEFKGRVNILSGLVGNKTIGSIEVDEFYKKYELVFKSEESFKNIVFAKGDPGDLAEYSFKDIQIFRINTGSGHLEKTIFGQFDDSKVILDLTNQETKVICDFNKKNQRVGQIFKADSDYLSSVALKLHFLGNGGVGNYSLELKEVEEGNDGFIVNDNIVSSFSFNTERSESVYEEKDGSGFFRFPLPARLEKGKYYYIGVKNTANFNVLNHLRFFGTKEDVYKDGQAVVVFNNGKTKNIGDLAIKIYSAEPTNRELIDGSIIQDLGDGEKLYSYQEDGNYLDELNKSYDNEGNLVYTFNTIHKIKNIEIDTSVMGEDAVFEYSVNNKEWTKLEKTNTKNDLNFYQANIDNIKSNTFFIRLGKDSNHQIPKINSLSITANLE